MNRTLLACVMTLIMCMALCGAVSANQAVTGLSSSGARLVDLQNNDGGWDWPLDNGNPATGSAQNTIGPIGMGLCKAYRATGDAAMLASIGKVSTFLLAKMYNFSPSDGYLAAELDSVLGTTAHVTHLNQYFYEPLAAGTYNRNGAGTLYNTAGYVNLLRTNRAGSQANMAAWDIGIGVVGAASCGADTTAWVAGTKAEIDELNSSQYYDVIGLAGALYGLAFVGEDFDPTAGSHASASSIMDLADILNSYQIAGSGGFAWNSAYVIPNDGNETIQETSYSALALSIMGSKYSASVAAAADYISGVQLATGGWENYPGSGENNEITAEGAWAVAAAGNRLILDATTESLYVKPGESVIVDMNAENLLQMVTGCQALIGYNSTFFPTAGAVTAGGGVWNELVYESWATAGELDTAIGVQLGGVVGTMADGKVAYITLTAGTTEGTTKLRFRADGENGYATMFSSADNEAVYPLKIDSTDIIIDGTAPTVTIPDDYSTSVAVQSIAASASDALAGLASFTMNGNAFTSPTTVTLVPGANTFTFVATDNAGNATTETLTITYNQPAPTIDLYASLAPNLYGSASSWSAWKVNAFDAILNGLTGVGVGTTPYNTFKDLGYANTLDYATTIVTTGTGTWLGLVDGSSELGTAVQFAYKINNGVVGNPGAAKLDLNNVTGTYRFNFDSETLNYDAWASLAGKTFGANQSWKGYDYIDGAWVEVTSGSVADMIICVKNRAGNESGPTQAEMNATYAELAGATGDAFQSMSYGISYSGHAGVGDVSTGVQTLNFGPVNDATKPVISITSPADGLETNVASQTIAGTVTDSETLASGVKEAKVFLNGVQVGSTYASNPVNFSEAVMLVEGNNVIRVDAVDFNGNTESQTINVLLDTAAPTISISDNLGADPVLQGVYTVTVAAADASAGLAGDPVVMLDGNVLSGTNNGDGTWTYTVTVDGMTANGLHTITADISDQAGNAAVQAVRTFTVNKNEIEVSVELQGFVGSSRAVTFEVKNAANAVIMAQTVTVDSFVGAVGTCTLTNVPDGAATIWAKTAWNLASKVAVFGGPDNQWTATLIGADKLLGGDLDGSNTINILDYSKLKMNWFTTNPVADVNGNGQVNTADYSILQSNFFKAGDAK